MRLPFTKSDKQQTNQHNLLGLFICVAAIFHTVAIFGVSFAAEKRYEGPVFDVTLASFKDDKAPDKPDFIAQENQQGSGTEDKALAPKTTSQADFQDSQVNPSPAPVLLEPEDAQEANSSKINYTVITASSTQQGEEQQTDQEKKDKDKKKREAIDATDNLKIASLEAQIALQKQTYAKRPTVLQITSSATKKDKGAAYQDTWRRIIEGTGNQNYPKEASSKKIYGSLRLLVAIKRNGQLHKVEILQSSGKPILDKAALRIVRMAAPFPPFPKELADVDIIEIIRTWRFDRSDTLSTDD